MNGARPAGCRTHPDGAAELRIADSLEGCHLLVPSLNELRIVVGTTPRGEQSIDAVARITEDLGHTPVTQSIQQHIRYGLAHWTPPYDRAAKYKPPFAAFPS